jgi:hypothetical protein
MDTMTTRRLLYRLLYAALLDIRVEGYTVNNKKVFHLADLMHNVPLQLDKVERGESSAEEVMHWLEKHAHEKGIERWLEQAIKEELKILLQGNQSDTATSV